MPPMMSEPEWVRKAREMGEAQGKASPASPIGHNWTDYDANDPRARDATRDRMGFGGQEGGAADYSWRARGRAEASQTRPTYAGAAPLQGHQAGSLAALQGAANGTAPSQAAILAKQQSDAAVNAAQSAAGSVKGGPGARAAAMRAAMGGQAIQQQAGAREAAAARAAEMAQARGQYAQASGAALSDDRLNEARQRSLNDAREMGYEELGFRASAQEQNNQLAQEQLATTRWGQGRDATMQDEQGTWGKVKDLTSMGAGAASSLGTLFMSDKRTKSMVSLDDAMQASFDGRGDEGVEYGYLPDPYTREPEKGVAGARRGYAADRAGKPGYMFGGADSEPEKEDGAPGTNDWKRYGAGGEADQHAILSNPGTEEAQKDSFGGRLAKAGGIMGRSIRSDMTTKSAIPYGSLAPMMRSDMRSKEYITSDARAKREAFIEGAQYGSGVAHGHKPTVPEYAADATGRVETPADKKKGERRYADVEEQPAPTARVLEIQHPQMMAAKAPSMRAGETQVARAEPTKPKPAPGFTMPDVAAMVRSDARAKRVIDLDEPEAIDLDEETIDLDKPEGTAMRDGSSDPRTNSFDKTFRRDTKADQKRVKKAVEDKAGKDADELLASFKSREKEGPKVAAKDGYLPDAAMFAAMKSMKPAAYTYKPEFAEPGRDPDEIFVGPKDARQMEKDPIAGTAVVREPGTGLRAIDKDKALRLTMGSLAVLAKDVQQLKKRRQ